MKIEPKQQQANQEQEDTVDNKLELLKRASTVHDKIIGRDISSDFLFAKFDELTEQAIIELSEQGFYVRRIFRRIAINSTRTIWDQQTMTWYRDRLSNETIQTIESQSQEIFGVFIGAPKVKALLKRNKAKNPMLRLQAGYEDVEEGEITNNQANDLIAKAQERMERNRKQKEER